MSTVMRLVVVVFALLGTLVGSGARAEDDGGQTTPELGLDLDAWHDLRPYLAPDEPQDDGTRYGLGLYPAISGVVGLPNGASFTAEAFLSFSKADSFSIFAGYGVERGGRAHADVYTLGWGGVRRLAAARQQNGFYGTFVRYRRWEVEHHGVHHGISAGTETGVGWIGLGFELGAARSDRNHWVATAQINLKVGLPMLLSWGRGT